jgi:cytochrome c biogenesis protein CcmG/thiol:disulfide interchange protein DsbE
VFVDLDGRAGKLSDYVGKIVVVNFWASWCPPCRKEIPALVQISKEYASRGVVVLGVAMDEGGLNGVRRFLQEVDVTYPVVIPDGSSSLSSVRGLPTTWLIDKQGRIAAIYSGAMTEDVFRQGIEQLLGEPRAVPDRPH